MDGGPLPHPGGRPILTRRRRGDRLLRTWFDDLLRAYGPQGWWPGRSRFEIVAGAILTQRVAWANVEKALAALRRKGLLTPHAMWRAGWRRTAPLVRPAGFYNQKARRLAAFLDALYRERGGRLDRLLQGPLRRRRQDLLAIPGIGPETADSILLYAGGRPVFVIDAYTRRVLARHGMATGDEPYDDLRRRFESALPGRTRIFNEYHALLVRLGKERCRRRDPLCSGCPLERYLSGGRPLTVVRDASRPGGDPIFRIAAPGTARRPGRAKPRPDPIELTSNPVST